MQDGHLDPEHVPALAYVHLSTSEKFNSLFTDTFEQVAFLGVESFTSVWGNKLRDLSIEDVDAWLDLVEQTGRSPDGLGSSDHFLYIGHKLA